VWTSILVLSAAAVITAGAAYWVLRAYRRAGGGANSPGPALMAGAAVAMAALVIYLVVGRPELPDAPFAERLAALQDRDPRSYTAEEALAVLTEAAREHPNDPLPYFYSGEVLLGQGRAEEAARAYDAALRRDPRSAQTLVGLGRAIVQMEGAVTPEALAAFQQAGEIGDDPVPWIYQAMAAMERDDAAETRRLWGEALVRMAPDDPRRAMAQRMASGELPEAEPNPGR
jgi:cytochrome c-type biogenesis protein CcmH